MDDKIFRPDGIFCWIHSSLIMFGFCGTLVIGYKQGLDFSLTTAILGCLVATAVFLFVFLYLLPLKVEGGKISGPSGSQFTWSSMGFPIFRVTIPLSEADIKDGNLGTFIEHRRTKEKLVIHKFWFKKDTVDKIKDLFRRDK